MINLTVTELNNRTLDECYISIIVIPSKILYEKKEGLVNEVELYSFFGCNIEGKRRYITTVFKDNYIKTSDWYDFLLSLKNKGISNIFFAIISNNIELSKALKLVFSEIQVFISCFDTINKLYKYYSYSYSNPIASNVYQVYIAKDISQYELLLKEFKEKYLNLTFISDLLQEDLNRARKYCEYDYELRKFIFSFYFYRDTLKSLRTISRSKHSFSSINEIIQELLPYIQRIESSMFCPKKQLNYIINLLYKSNKFEFRQK